MIPVHLIVSFIYLCDSAGSTEGDQDPWVIECIDQCSLYRNCTNSEDNEFVKNSPWYLTATMWDCTSDCAYLCMRVHNQQRVTEGLESYQYHGKWPFLRVFSNLPLPPFFVLQGGRACTIRTT
eukprot:TRINITY_DN8311_c0_g1_i1.p2 TRINITY_DN8311_c0_g1~~TRINITY_DN8311_c0_g1_i1.p2  ORF type:complete len:138 (-),score=18.23 TRINITY_DN8311_c0_g1_i1:883-1251(-)